MRKAAAIGTLLFLIFLVARIPAGVLTRLLEPVDDVRLLNLEGTVWAGRGELLVAGLPLGRLAWSFEPVTLLQLKPGYDLELVGPAVALSGFAASNGVSSQATVSGTLGSQFVNQWLAPYNIDLGGSFTVTEVIFELSEQSLTRTNGTVSWSGGPITYELSGKMHKTTLPPIRADLGPGPEAIAFAEGQSTPLLTLMLKPDGFAKIGVTKHLTKIAGNPWPGGDPDHVVVLEVEEQVF